MTSGNVDENDMFPPDPLDEETLEAFLSGRLQPGELGDALVAFSQDVDAVMSGPAPTPKGNLAALLREGFSPQTDPAARPTADQGTPWATSVPAPAMPKEWVPVSRPRPASPPPVPPSGRRRSLRLIPRLAGLGLAAKVGLGLGVAAASVTGAGAAGVLPDPAQEVVATVVDTVTPFHIPESGSRRPAVDRPRGGGGTVGKVGGPATVPGGGNGITGDVEGPGDAGGGGGAGVGPSANNSTGLDRANETPAAGNAPTAVPVPTPGSPGQKGLDRANETPAAGNAPTAVPVPTPGSPGQRGLDRANETPAADRHLPTTTSTTIAP
ncbi:MAG: hypothetical protein M3314_10700 [Actinomycetota bacterium]|nr:hypothetical protein [Actinomycetota bacterium]